MISGGQQFVRPVSFYRFRGRIPDELMNIFSCSCGSVITDAFVKEYLQRANLASAL
jgi:hypothetical protein